MAGLALHSWKFSVPISEHTPQHSSSPTVLFSPNIMIFSKKTFTDMLMMNCDSVKPARTRKFSLHFLIISAHILSIRKGQVSIAKLFRHSVGSTIFYLAIKGKRKKK